MSKGGQARRSGCPVPPEANVTRSARGNEKDGAITHSGSGTNVAGSSRSPVPKATAAHPQPGVPSAPRQDLSDQARTRLEEMIVSLELPPGSVWSEAELSAQLGIGRTPVREALQRLENEHLVTILPRHGVQVTEINVIAAIAATRAAAGARTP